MPNDTDDKKLIGQMFKSMIDRNPKKRKIKPNSRNYEMLDLDLYDTSSEDEDYTLPNNAPVDEESDDGNENEDSEQNEESEDDEENEDSENEESEQDDEDSEDETNHNYSSNLNENSYSISETTSTENKTSIKFKLNNSNKSNQVTTNQHIHNNKSTTQKHRHDETKFKKLLICSICLSDESLEIDEIAECDCCLITVHESCYGLINPNVEVESLNSDASSNTTEPWFCDACKANKSVDELSCELCPKQGGIFKQTETGRWVHLVCALYINGVAFSNTQQLSGITLFEMNYERWAAKSCSLCEDERFARTGVCISCDAGMCRNYFHVTCAQSYGLLCDAQNIEDTEAAVADPFYAHCKQHAIEKHIVKIKKRNYLALQLRLKQLNSIGRSMDERILNKLEEVRSAYNEETKIALERKNILQNLNYKAPRPLLSSSNAVRKLISKAELLGMSPQAQIISSQDMMDMRKKWHIPVAFSVEYVGYYLDRNARLKSMQKKQEELNKQTEQLKNQEEQAINRYEEKAKNCEQINETFNESLSALTNLYNSLSLLTNSKLSIPPKLLPNTYRKSSTIKMTNGVSGISSVISNRNGDQEYSNRKLLKCCGICKRSNDQHSLALCDNCKLYYHFQCLDPPLTRLPRKSKYGFWQCSECTQRQDEEEEELAQQPVDINETRKLRENVNAPMKYLPESNGNFLLIFFLKIIDETNNFIFIF